MPAFHEQSCKTTESTNKNLSFPFPKLFAKTNMKQELRERAVPVKIVVIELVADSLHQKITRNMV
jgi:hypothetical protein